MGDSYIGDKLPETIANFLKRSKVIEKIDKMKFYITSFVILSSFLGITNFFINYSNSQRITLLEKQKENIIETIENHNNECVNRVINRIDELEKTLLDNQKKIHIILFERQDKLFEQQEKILNNIDLLSQKKKIEIINVSTSTSFETLNTIDKLNPVEKLTPVDKLNKSPDPILKSKENKDEEDNELINECYDYIPLNNIKKTTGLNWIFK